MERCIIDPSPRDARELRSWLRGQGDMRGFLVQEDDKPEYLIVWDSYGWTHTDAFRYLGLSRRAFTSCLIFRLDGTVYNEHSARGPIDNPVIKALYHPIEPRWVLS